MAKKYIKTDTNGIPRCWWCGDDPQYVRYHDNEWGRPVSDDLRMFEKICLEGFQAGLSWLTILRKREAFRKAFKEFQPEKVAKFGDRQIERLLSDEGIVRHRGKIEATINNAQKVLEMQASGFSLAAFCWSFEPKKARRFDASRGVTDESTAMSKALRKRGWKFVGPTTCYSFMQSMGIVNDHHPKCHLHDPIEQLRADFERPI